MIVAIPAVDLKKFPIFEREEFCLSVFLFFCFVALSILKLASTTRWYDCGFLGILFDGCSETS